MRQTMYAAFGDIGDDLSEAIEGGGAALSLLGTVLEAGIVSGVSAAMPIVRDTLSGALAEGADEIARRNRTVFVVSGITLGSMALGSLILAYLQYRKLSGCCPASRRAR